MASRVSRLFGARRETATTDQSHRTSAACSVPIFLSPSSERVDEYHHERLLPQSAFRRETGTPSPPQRFTIPASSVYSELPAQQHQTQYTEQIEELPAASPDSIRDLEEGTSSLSYATSETPIARERRRKRKRVSESTRQRIESKKRLSMAFGVTVLAALITCKSRRTTNVTLVD